MHWLDGLLGIKCHYLRLLGALIFLFALACSVKLLPRLYLILLLSRSPSTYKQPLVGFGDVPSGFGKAFDLSRSRSPQSDAGYGTSFDSNEPRAQTGRRDIDIDGLSELLVSISLNLSLKLLPGLFSLCG